MTDGDGIFALPVPSATPLELRIAAAEHELFVQHEQLARWQRLRVKYLLDRKSYGQYESYVRSDSDRAEVSRTTLSGPEITRIPGTFGDPFRVVSVLPGVTNVAGLLPLLDRARLEPRHHRHPARRRAPAADVPPAGWAERRAPGDDRPHRLLPGRLPGHVRRLHGRHHRRHHARGAPDERRVDIDLTLTQAGALVREPIEPLHTTVTVAGRIGYPGVLLSLLAPNVSLAYWDYQARLDFGSERNHFVAFFFGAEDELKLRPAPTQPLQTVARFTFHRMDFRYQHGTTDANELVRIVFGYDDSFLGNGNGGTQIAGDTGLGNGVWSVNPQVRAHRALRRWLTLDAGAESYDHAINHPPPASNAPQSQAAMDVANLFNPNGFYTQTGAFVQAIVTPAPRLRVIPGVRADLYDERLDGGGGVTQTSVDPRLLARYHLTDAGRGDVWVKGVVGRYHQPPRLFIPVPGLEASSLNLGLLASTQYSVGAEAALARAIEIDVNAYYNSMDPILFDLAVNPTATDLQPPQPTMPPDQVPHNPMSQSDRTLNGLFTKRVGRSYGLEVLLRRRSADGLFGWVSYTLSRSERLGPQGWQLFDFDRLHVLNLVAGQRLPRNWEVGARVLYQTGTPLTTVFGTNVARSDAQFRVDLRLDKRAVWNRWLLDFYVDIINTTVAAESGGLVGGDAFRYIVPTLGFRAVL